MKLHPALIGNYATDQPTNQPPDRQTDGLKAVGPGCLHGNSHFARQFRCFTRQFLNDNLTMKNGKKEKKNDDDNFFQDSRFQNCL